jgi:hypothetical protein
MLWRRKKLAVTEDATLRIAFLLFVMFKMMLAMNANSVNSNEQT